MSRIKEIEPNQASGKLKDIYSAIESKMGGLPNIFKHMGNSPAVLKGFLSMNEAASETSLTPKLREEIALIVSQTNACNYCLSAHSVMAKGTGLQDIEIFDARKGLAKDAKTKAILQFAKRVVELKGHISDSDVKALINQGVTEQELVEIIFVISINMFTNYFNHIIDPVIDFPKAQTLN